MVKTYKSSDGWKKMRDTCYVLHVKKGFEDREKSIVHQFSRLDLPFEWVLDHDKEDLAPELLEFYQYRGNLSGAAISCVLKHIRAWELIAQGTSEGGFVFEDDVLMDLKNFKALSQKCIEEFHENGSETGYISLGSGCALYVPWTKKQKNKMLYPAELVRATDSYWINRKTAEKMVAWIKKNGFDQPADHLIDQIAAAEKIPIFWLDPTLVNQGSHTGLFPSSIQNLERGTFLDQLGWQVKIIRRKYLYPLMGIDLRKNG
jgi:glycosyl transferase family 25